jgi:D-sedoheptulose 7-phosphate isomerase
MDRESWEAEIRRTLTESADLKRRVADEMADDIVRAAQMMVECLRNGGIVAFCGNGGSAADAQHLAGEIVGRFRRERPGYAGLALTTDTSVLTAIGNDYGFDQVFARQVEGLLRAGDILVALSTSGNAANCCLAVAKAREKGIATIGLTGADGGKLAQMCDVCLKVPHSVTARIQEAHITIGHILCGLVEDALAEAGE